MTPKNPRQKTKGWCWVEPGWAPRGPEALLGALGAQEHCRGHPHPCPVTAAMGDPGPERLAAQVTHEATGQGREDAGPAALCASPRALAPPSSHWGSSHHEVGPLLDGGPWRHSAAHHLLGVSERPGSRGAAVTAARRNTSSLLWSCSCHRKCTKGREPGLGAPLGASSAVSWPDLCPSWVGRVPERQEDPP